MKTSIKNPNQRAIVTMAGFVGFTLMILLAAWGLSIVGYIETTFLWIAFILLGFFTLMLIIVWVIGIYSMQRAKSFLESDRILVSWTYSSAEWQKLKGMRWQEEKGDWKVQFGCLAFLLALTGLLTGIMLGWEDGVTKIITNGLAGLMLGGLAGSAVGLLVAGSNYWSALKDYHDPEPGLIALGVNEIFASDDYFKGDGVNSYISEAKLNRKPPATLEIQLIYPPRPRLPSEEQWIIPVPEQWVERVEEILPLLAQGQEK